MRKNCQNWARGRRLASWLVIVSLLSAWLPTVEGQEFVVEQETLPNGLRVWVSPQEDGRVLVGLVVLAGEADTAPWPRQTAHLLEHLLSQSRAGESKEALKGEIRQRGWDKAASTHNICTQYRAGGPPEDLLLLLELLRDLVFENNLAGKDIEGEKQIIIAEFKGEPNWAIKAYDRIHGYSVWEKICREFFPNSRAFEYQGLPTLDLPLIDRKALEAYYQDNYSPSRAVLIVVGPMDVEEALESVRRVYGGVPGRPTRERPLRPPEHAGRLVEINHRYPAVFYQQAHVRCGVRLDDWVGRRPFAGMVLRRLLSERLPDELVARRSLAYCVHMEDWVALDTGVVYSSVEVGEADVEEAAKAMKGEYLRLGREGLSAEDFTRLKKSLVSEYRGSLSDVRYRTNELARFVAGRRGKSDELPASLSILSSLEHEEVSALAREMFREENMFVAISRPLLNVWQSTIALIIIVAVLVGLVVLAVRWRRRAKKAAAKAAQS